MSSITQDKCGLGRLRLDTDGPEPGERQGRRGGELRSRFVGTWTCRDDVPRSAVCGYCTQSIGREGLHIRTACIRLAHEGCRTRHITVDGADDDLRNALATASDGVHRRQSRALSAAGSLDTAISTTETRPRSLADESCVCVLSIAELIGVLAPLLKHTLCASTSLHHPRRHRTRHWYCSTRPR